MSEDLDEEIEEEQEEGWYDIDEPPFGIVTGAQEEAIREMALDFGFENLRGFHMFMRARDWDYYDILQMAYE